MVLIDFILSFQYEYIYRELQDIEYISIIASCISSGVENKSCNSWVVRLERTKNVTTLGDPLGVKNFPIFPVLKISFIKNNIIIDYFIENDFLGVSG